MKVTYGSKVRETWMREFESAVLAARPELSGRLNWDSAAFFYNSGISAIQAAARYLMTA